MLYAPLLLSRPLPRGPLTNSQSPVPFAERLPSGYHTLLDVSAEGAGSEAAWPRWFLFMPTELQGPSSFQVSFPHGQKNKMGNTRQWRWAVVLPPLLPPVTLPSSLPFSVHFWSGRIGFRPHNPRTLRLPSASSALLLTEQTALASVFCTLPDFFFQKGTGKTQGPDTDSFV